MQTRPYPNEARTEYYAVRINPGHSYAGAIGGGVVKVTEPIARTLIASDVATAVDELPVQTKASKRNTKSVAAEKVLTK